MAAADSVVGASSSPGAMGRGVLRRVDQLAVVSGLSARRLQRLFSDYVGVSRA